MPNPWTGKGNPYTRKEVIERLHETVKEGNAIIAAGAGTGISAKFIERGGGDLIIIYQYNATVKTNSRPSLSVSIHSDTQTDR